MTKFFKFAPILSIAGCAAGGMKNIDLYMSVDEQAQALIQGGFSSVRCFLEQGGLVLHGASA